MYFDLFGTNCKLLSFYGLVCVKEYVPDHKGMAAKLSWEMEQQLGFTAKSEIAR